MMAIALKLIRSPMFYIALLILQVGVQTIRLSRAHDLIDQQQVRIDSLIVTTKECVDANKSLDAAAADLGKRLDAIIQERQVDQIEREKLIAQRDLQINSALAKADEQRKQRDALWKKTTSCEGLGAIDVAHACSDVGERLRDRSTGTR